MWLVQNMWSEVTREKNSYEQAIISLRQWIIEALSLDKELMDLSGK